MNQATRKVRRVLRQRRSRVDGAPIAKSLPSSQVIGTLHSSSLRLQSTHLKGSRSLVSRWRYSSPESNDL